MNMRMNRMINEAVSRFVIKTFEASNSDTYLDMLDVLELWEDYRIENANGFVIDPKLINKKIGEVFKDAKVSEYRINGIKKKVPVQKSKKVPTDEEREQMCKDSLMSTRFAKFVHDRAVEDRSAPFEAAWFANFKQTYLTDGFYSLGTQEISLQSAEKWLKKQEFLYFDEKINKWCFHQRQAPVF